MPRFLLKPFFYVASFAACFILAFTSGCASGGYKLTRQYSRWVNSQQIILRIVIYILTGIVFAVTLLIDAVVFNTIDFWEGKVSAGSYDFKDGEKTYQVKHELVPGTQLKRSTIQIMDSKQHFFQTVVLQETRTGEIETLVDGKVKARVRDISAIPIATVFDKRGRVIEEKTLRVTEIVSSRRLRHAEAI